MKIDIKRLKVTYCDITKHEPYLDIDYEELQNFNFVQSDKRNIMQNFQL